jgi:hypothetical protein
LIRDDNVVCVHLVGLPQSIAIFVGDICSGLENHAVVAHAPKVRLYQVALFVMLTGAVFMFALPQ